MRRSRPLWTGWLSSALVLGTVTAGAEAAWAQTPSPAAPSQAAATTPSPSPAAAQPAAGAGLTSKEREVLERINRMKATPWRTFGACKYNWGSWKLSEGGVRYTAVECGTPAVGASVAVHCDTLKVNRRVGDEAWGTWRLPRSVAESSQQGGEDLMVAALCANVAPGSGSSGSGKGDAPTPATPPTPAVKPQGSNTPRPKP